jgi:protoporphyrinogen oxidase
MSLHAAVIGGGISGIASAYRLAQMGHRVTLLEIGDALGGLGGTFVSGGLHLERFYHCLLPGDRALLELLDSIGLGDAVEWRRTGMGFMHRGRVYPLNTALDLLRFRPLSLFDRLRMGWMGLRARSAKLEHGLDGLPVADWLRKTVGERALETVWKPMLEAKIGDSYTTLPALWLRSRLHREKNTQAEVKGFVLGGYRRIVRELEHALNERNVEVRLRTAVDAIELDGDRMALRFATGVVESFDAVVAAAPLVEFHRMARKLPLEGRLSSPKLDYQGVISGVFLLTKPLTPYYWMPIVASGATCQGVIEMSNLVPPERSKGLYVTYLVNYAHRGSELYRKDERELLDLYRKDLETLFPDPQRSIVDQALFRAPYVEPIWPLRYRERMPAASVLPGKLYLATTAQVYPRVNSWNSCCEVVDEMAAVFARETARVAAPVGA